MGGNPIQFDYSLIVMVIFPLLISVILLVFVAYFMVSTLRYFKRQAMFNKEMLQKLDILLKSQMDLHGKSEQH